MQALNTYYIHIYVFIFSLFRYLQFFVIVIKLIKTCAIGTRFKAYKLLKKIIHNEKLYVIMVMMWLL